MKKKILDGPTNMISRVFKSYLKKKKGGGVIATESRRQRAVEGCLMGMMFHFYKLKCSQVVQPYEFTCHY